MRVISNEGRIHLCDLGVWANKKWYVVHLCTSIWTIEAVAEPILDSNAFNCIIRVGTDIL